MSGIKYIFKLRIFLLFVLGNVTLANGQFYHSFSLRVQQMGFDAHPFSSSMISPEFSIGNRHLQAALSLDVPIKGLLSTEKWAGEKLRPNENVQIDRYVGKFALKSQPQAGSLGVIYAAANFYLLDVSYQNTAVFGDETSKSRLNIATFGIGLFEFWEIDWPINTLLGLESMVFTNIKSVDLWIELKVLFMQNIKFGMVVETLQPKPRFTNFYWSIYLEYALRW